MKVLFSFVGQLLDLRASLSRAVRQADRINTRVDVLLSRRVIVRRVPPGRCGVCGLLIETHPTTPECGALQERADAGDEMAASTVAALRASNPYLQWPKCPMHPEGGVCEPMESEPWRCVYGEHLVGVPETQA